MQHWIGVGGEDVPTASVTDCSFESRRAWSSRLECYVSLLIVSMALTAWNLRKRQFVSNSSPCLWLLPPGWSLVTFFCELLFRNRNENSPKYSPVILLCWCFIAGETPCPTPEGTPMSDASDSPVMDTHGVYHGSSGLGGLPRSDIDSAAPQKRAVRSLSWDAGTMTQTRLQILSCVRSVRDNIRSQISSSSPSSPVSRSMWLDVGSHL